jgi:general stress protein CsbA
VLRPADGAVLPVTRSRVLAVAALAAVVAAAAFAAYVNVDNVVGAFGDGPPYYGRSTNMDKWANPIPFLVVLDVVVIAAGYLAARWAIRVLRR